jgi:hypothetical protein
MDESEKLNEEDLKEVKESIITPKELLRLRELEEIEEYSKLHPQPVPVRLTPEEEKELNKLRVKEMLSRPIQKIRKFLQRL